MHTLETHAQRIESMYRASTGLQPSIALRARRDAPIIAIQDRKLTSSSTTSCNSIGSAAVTAAAVSSSERAATTAIVHTNSLDADSNGCDVTGALNGTVNGTSSAVNGSCSSINTKRDQSEAMALMAQQVQTMAVALEVKYYYYTVCYVCVMHVVC
jgi:hypothetical protein